MRTDGSPNWTTGSLAEKLGAAVVGRADLPIRGPAALDAAEAGDIAFLRDARFAAAWAGSRASAALVSRGLDVPGHDPATRALLVVPNADVGMAVLLGLFVTPMHSPAGIDPSARIDATAVVSETAAVGAHVVIGPGCEVGDGAVIMPGVVLGRNVRVGAATVLHPNVVVYDGCRIGSRCVVHAGVVIGADGFGYAAAPDGRGLLKIPHIGTVEIHDHVEIGAGSCVDRGKFAATVIGAGTKIDNLVQIGHNVRIGRGCVICGCTGIAGSVTIGDGVQIGGGCGIGDGLTIGSGARLGAKAALMDDIPPGQSWIGIPAMPARDQFRRQVALNRLADVKRGS